ncbi:MAG: extracellular solute-binding protein family 3, partial [Verrucomicrobiales bacterium]|nr:extracellular solute-binding protein family 3 [Verrucomicrobiales bacterium]
YNEVLVRKLEEKNTELEQSIKALQKAHDSIAELNVDLERRVRERTAELQAALDNVKKLSALLPICSYCKNIRDEKDYWRQVDEYINRHTGTQFSHSVCPTCYVKHVQPLLDEMGIGKPDKGVQL